jgi:hypothetical protein
MMKAIGAMMVVLLVAASWSVASGEGQVADCNILNMKGLLICLVAAESADHPDGLQQCCENLSHDEGNCLHCQLQERLAERGPLAKIFPCIGQEATCKVWKRQLAGAPV